MTDTRHWSLRLWSRSGIAALVAAGIMTPTPAQASWVSNNCKTSGVTETNPIKLSIAANFALTARYEGYQWGGGCWIDDNRDPTPNTYPRETTNTYGEGPDCSGLVFKSWRIDSGPTDPKTLKDGWKYWPQEYYVHGPWASGSYESTFKAPDGVVQWKAESKSQVTRLHALASASHVALFWSTTSSGARNYLEAKGEDYGTDILTETYLGNTSFYASSRQGWVPECSPHCA